MSKAAQVMSKEVTINKDGCLITAYSLHDDGIFPNNERTPLMVYRKAISLPQDDPASGFERAFARNNWSGGWRGEVYDYHHYHSTGHEALGVFQGTARLLLGGESGVQVDVSSGDLVVIPAGVAHKCLQSSSDFSVVGSYPDGQTVDMNYGRSGERPGTVQNISRVSKPSHDPVFGVDGPLNTIWS
eukprot:GILK01010769.1.p1 GENE.GILK01010769.1~~GILK01010769.1.p1  ORF type:complete len:202 (-),score=5.82 GILK01010769.1:47-604(-)